MRKLVRVCSFLFSTCLPVVALAQTTIRVNVGGPAYRDSKGQSWSADYGFNTGKLSQSAPSATVTGTSDPSLFKSARVGVATTPDLQYQFAVANGLYKVNLYFAETYFRKVGSRVFDVQMQGATVFSGLDIFAQTGSDHALVKSAQISATGGKIVVRFAHRANANVPIISAIEILPSGTAPSVTAQPTSLTIPAGRSATFKVVAAGTAPLSYQWQKNGTAISGATSTTYTTPPAATSDNGDSFRVAISNSVGKVMSAAATLQLTSLPTVMTGSLPGATVGKGYSTTLQASGGTTPYTWSLSAGTLPAGVSLVSSTGVISGTPTTAGTVSITVRVKDSANNTGTKALSVVVAAPAQPPTVTTTTLPGGTAGTAYSTTLQASGGTNPYSWSISAGALPAGLALSATGQVSGTPTTAGTASFTVQVKDAANNTGTKALSVAVTTAASLRITTTSLADGQVKGAYSASLAATGGTKPYAWSVSSGSLPAGLTLGSSTGQILGTPTSSGSFSFAILVKDSSGVQESTTQFFSILVSAAVAGTPISSCQTLGNTGTTYTLESDVSAAGTCFTVSADDITLDLNGHTVTYNSASQSTATNAILVTGNNNNFAVYNGRLTEGSGTSVAGSSVIELLTPMAGPTIHDITFTWRSDYAQGIDTNYSNTNVANGALIYNNVFNNNTAAVCTNVGCRNQLQSATIRILNAKASLNSPQIYGNTVNGGPQGAIVCDAPGCIIHDNMINPGTTSASESNDFAIWCWASCQAYHNTIMTPLTASTEGRGIQISGVETSTNGATVYNNTITVIDKNNNAEYNGCPLGGAYGIQFDDNPNGATVQNNNVTAVGDTCWGSALRLTDTETTNNISQNSTYKAIRKSAGSPACGFGVDATDSCAHAVSLDGPTGFLSRNDIFQGDSDDLFFDWDGASGVIFISPTFLKGTTNPSPDFHTFVFRNGGAPVSNIFIQDATFQAGTTPTDIDLPAQSGNNQSSSLYITWSQTITVSKASGGAAAGAAVSFVDALGNNYSSTTNSQGVAVVVVTQYRLNNGSGANGVENRNPFQRTVSMTGCTTNTVTGLTISATSSGTVSLGGC